MRFNEPGPSSSWGPRVVGPQKISIHYENYCLHCVNSTKFGQLIPTKISKFIDTQMLDFKSKMHRIQFRLGLRPRPRWVGLQRSPRPHSWIKGGLLLREGEEWGKGRERKEMGREVVEGKGEGPQVTVELWPLRALLRHNTN